MLRRFIVLPKLGELIFRLFAKRIWLTFTRKHASCGGDAPVRHACFAAIRVRGAAAAPLPVRPESALLAARSQPADLSSPSR